MRVVIELKRNENAEIVLNNLYKQTPMESVFGVNMVALHRRPAAAAQPQGDDRGVRAPSPRSRHAAHGLRPAQGTRARPHPRRPGGRARQHRRSHRADQGVADAGRSEGGAGGARVARRRRAGNARARRRRSMRAPTGSRRRSACTAAIYRLSESQAQAILDLRLHRLTGLEQDKILEEYAELLDVDPRPERHPRAPGTPAAGHPRRADRRSATSTATRAARASSTTSPTSRSKT